MARDPDSIYIPPQGPPQGSLPSSEIFKQMGQENIYAMCAAFYRLLEQSEIRSMFPQDMPAASRKLAAFLVGVLGGPPLYRELYGPPRMRARHLPHHIDQHARDIWLGCFFEVLDDAPAAFGFPEVHLADFRQYLDEFSAWMVNVAPASS